MFAVTIWWEGMVVILMALVSGVLPDQQDAEMSHEDQVNARCEETFDEIASAVTMSRTAQYCEQFEPELAKKIRPAISAVLDSPKQHNLSQRYKVLEKEIRSYEAVYRVALLTISICPTGYKDNIEYATVRLSPLPDDEPDGKFFAESTNDPTKMKWKVTEWTTEKIVPYDSSKDR